MNSHEESLKLFEGMGIIFYQEGSDVHKAMGIMQHVTGVDLTDEPNWAASAPLDLVLDSDVTSAIYEVLKWCMNSGYETGQ